MTPKIDRGAWWLLMHATTLVLLPGNKMTNWFAKAFELYPRMLTRSLLGVRVVWSIRFASFALASATLVTWQGYPA